ncbi:MAG TPA: NAD(P)/FAD-dependent oxidoreductase [Chloroflexia bacterium]|nr:NAD(P)/FAD-dependent oxidoreductase [Chloroflexia bacterium]
MYDVIVVGARCAGSPTAMLLAQKGYRVLMVDRSSFPSDIFRNHVLLYPAMAHLQKWGLLDEVAATGCPPITKFTQHMGDFPLTGYLQLPGDLPGLLAPRRKYLDMILVNAAVKAGAELRENFAVQELLWDGDKVVGIRGRSQGGAPVDEYAKLVIGADGLHSVVARCAGANLVEDRPTIDWIYYSYWSDMTTDGVEFYRFDDEAMLGFPTNDGLHCVATFGPVEGFADYRTDIEGNFHRTISRVPHFAERVYAGRRAEKWIGTAELPNILRRPHGPGWALVGDAGFHKDPVTANGISDAFCDAQLLADAADAGLSGRQPMADALAGYEQQRNVRAMPVLEGACMAATFGPLPGELLGLRQALRENQEDTNAFFAVAIGAQSPMEFFAPENMGRIMSRAMAGAPA